MLDGASRIEQMVKKVENLGQKAVAITDHGVLHGAYYLWDECRKNGNVKPIIGVEAYVTPGTSRHDPSRVFFGGPYGDSTEDKKRQRNDVSARGAYTHMTLWAENNEGLYNLNWMQSKASIDRTLDKWARIDRDLMQTYSKGLLASTGCPSGSVQTYLRLGMYKEAVREAAELQDIFGKGNFWVELMDHGIDFERTTRDDLLKLAKEIDAPLLATNDLHYVESEDAVAQDALLCINSGDTLDNPDRFKFDGSGYYVKSTEEMFEIFKEIPEALTNTLEIAERCDISYTKKDGRFMPHVPLPELEKPELLENAREKIELAKLEEPEGMTKDEMIHEAAYFIEQVNFGLNERFPEGVPENYVKQAEYEVDTIVAMGFPSYFLVVSDLVKWAKENGIFVGPGRGSAAGSLVAYALKITDLDPIEHKLIFERFLNPDRISLPDIDIDFEEGGRDKVIEYCSQKYGDDNVAQIITYGKILAKQALRDSARIMGFEYNVGDVLSKAYPEPSEGSNGKIDQFLNQKEYERYRDGEGFRELLKTNKIYQDVTEMATHIEGLTRGWGVHASGVLVSNAKIADVCPTMRRAGDDAIITQFEAHGCEDLGFVKMDFLGLKNLNTNKAALDNIRQAGKGEVDLLKIPLDDPKTFDLISNAETLGVFQLDGEGMRTLMKRMKPTSFNDISATIALFRPGPMGVNAHNDYADRKNGRKPIEPIHPEVDEALREILSDTYGLVVFQEQIQFAARKLAGFTLGQADLLRRAMGKKKIEDLMAAKAQFEPGMLENGYSQAAVDAVWNVFQPFAAYAFNRAHTACYAFNAYTNAYLKANFPEEFMAALLSTFGDKHDRLSIYLAECSRMSIEVEVPSVNRSHVDFSPEEGKILFGMGAIRNVGEATAEEIIRAREEKGAFTDFNDFLYKVPESVCNKRKIESLIKAGAFDEFGESRKALMLIHEEAVDAVLPIKRKESLGQFDLFDSLGLDQTNKVDETLEVQIPQIDDWDKRTKLDFEKEMLGLYVSDHPLSKLSTTLAARSDIALADLLISEKMQAYSGEPRGAAVQVAGLVQAVSRRVAKKSGNPYIRFVLEDLSGTAEIGLFGKSFEQYGPSLMPDQIIQVKCKLRVEEDGTGSLSVNEIEALNISLDSEIPEVILEAQSNVLSTADGAKQITEIIQRFPGDSPVVIKFTHQGKTQRLMLPDTLRVNPNSSFYSEIKALGLKVL
jgi:DNA polymerase-3 subunit alpha